MQLVRIAPRCFKYGVVLSGVGGVMEMDGRPKLWVMVGEDEEGCNQKAPALSFFELAVLSIHDV